MTSTSAFLKKTVDAGDRAFQVQVLRFENGNFVSVTEGNERIGSMVVSLATGPRPATTTVIPARTESLFIKLAAEKISSTVQGIAIVSVSVQKEIDIGSAKAIMREITEMIRNV